jgi:hypothetical protein
MYQQWPCSSWRRIIGFTTFSGLGREDTPSHLTYINETGNIAEIDAIYSMFNGDPQHPV